MIDKLLNFLSQPYTENLLYLFSVIGLFATILVGFIETKKTIKSSYENILKANMIEQASKLPETVQEFVKIVSETMSIYIQLCNCPNNKQLKKIFENSNKKQFDEMKKIPPLLISYGSEKSIVLFNVFRSSFKDAEEKRGNISFNEYIKTYYCLPLLVSLVKYDASGEVVNPSVMYEYLMSDFKKFNPPIINEIIEMNDVYVQKLKLSKDFKWKNNLL